MRSLFSLALLLTRSHIRYRTAAIVFGIVAMLGAASPNGPILDTVRGSDSALAASVIHSSDAAPQLGAESQSVVGWFSIQWQDDFGNRDGLIPAARPVYILDVERVDGTPQRFTARLLIDDAVELPDGELDFLNRQRVRIQGLPVEPSDPDSLGKYTFRVSKLEAEPLIGGVGGVSVLDGGGVITGTQPWVILRCRFPDQPLPTESGTAPGSFDYFDALINNPNGLNAYVNATSYGKANLNGSAVVEQWFALPQNRDGYSLASDPARLDVIEAGGDCIDAADAVVDFSPFTGIGIVFNDSECCQGGFRFLSVDGEDRLWGVTYMSSDASHHVWAHELGHGFGLPHTAGNGREYNDPWSIMGVSACFTDTDPVLGCIGQHPIAEQKIDILGWLTDERLLTVPSASNRTVMLERLAQPDSVNPQLIRVPIQGSDTRFYTIETRKRIGFDANLPDDSVVIHLVDQDKPPNLQADLVGVPASDSYYFPSDATIWQPGREFVDSANDIRIRVLTSTSSGFVINIQNGSLPLRSLALSGPDVSLANSVRMIADAQPITASVPITYLWQATELPSVQLSGGVSSTVDLVWQTPGTKFITVTATNPANQVVMTKAVTILGADLGITATTTAPEITEGDRVTISLTVENSGPDPASDVALSVKLNNVHNPQVGTITKTDFTRGTLTNTSYSDGEAGLTLSDGGRSAGEGIYESAVLDGERAWQWATIDWQPQFPTGKSLPDHGQVESGYRHGNVNMRGNVLLLHMDEPEDSTQFLNAASSIFPGAACAADSCPTMGVDGRFGTAAHFDGQSSMTVAPSPRFNFGMRGFSQELWFYPTTDDLPIQGLLGAGEGYNQYPSLYYEENGIRFRFGHQGGSAWVQSVNSIQPNAWNHVAVSFDGTTFLLFINGEEKYRSDDWAGNIPRPARNGIQIGRIGNAFFSGRIDEVAFYRRGLTAEEIVDRYRRGVTRLGLQVRLCPTADCDSVAFQGPDGSGDSFYSESLPSVSEIPTFYLAGNEASRFIQYRAVLGTDDPAFAPVLESVVFAPTYGSPSVGQCRGTSEIHCDLDELADGSSALVEIAFDALQSGTIVPQSTLSSATFDPSAVDNELVTPVIFVKSLSGMPVGVGGPIGQSLIFVSGISAGPNATYEWDFGDGTTGVGNPIEHIYIQPGVYTVTTTVTPRSGGEAQIETQEVRILGMIYLPSLIQ